MKSKSNASKIILYIVGTIIVLGIIGAVAFFLTPSSSKASYTAIPVSRMDLTQTVTATGQVTADQTATLAFDQPGTIASVNVAVGDTVKKGEILTALESDILQSNLQGAQADVQGAEAGLASVQQGPKSTDIAVYSQKVSDAETAFSSAIRDAYLKTEDAIENQTDVFFTNAVSSNPVINVPTGNTAIQNQIDNERLILGGDLANWQNDLAADPTNQVSTTSEMAASTTLAYAKSFLTDLANIMNYLSPNNSGYTQSQISADRTVVINTASELNAALTEYTGAAANVDEATASLTLEESSSTAPTIDVQQAAIAKAQAEVASDQSQINHSEITAPFDGIITDVEPKVGEVFASGQAAITLISNGPFKIVINVPETNIAQISLGEMANVTLDAYGSGTDFPAQVTQIDPAETVVNGVNSYQVTLHFLSTDSRILSGMTANVSIQTGTVTNVLAVPASDIITRGSNTFVLVKNTASTTSATTAASNSNGTNTVIESGSDQFTEKQVTTGITGSNGYVQITSGLSDGDQIATF